MISDINLFTQCILILFFVGFDYVLLPVANRLSLAFVTFSLCSNYSFLFSMWFRSISQVQTTRFVKSIFKRILLLN